MLVWAIPDRDLLSWYGLGRDLPERGRTFSSTTVMIRALIVLWQQSDGRLWSAATDDLAPENPTFASEFTGFVAIVGTMVTYFAAVMSISATFSRYAKSNRAMVLGNLAGPYRRTWCCFRALRC